MSASSPPPALRRASTVLLLGALTGALAGGLACVVDGAWSWGRLEQFLPGIFAKLGQLVFLMVTGGSVGAVAGFLLAALGLFFARRTPLGELWRATARARREARERGPSEALTALSVVLAGVPSFFGVLGATYLVLAPAMMNRRHSGLVVAVSMVAALGALVAAILLGAALTGLLRRALAGLARRLGDESRIARALAAGPTPWIALVLLLGAGAALVLVLGWETISLLPLRPVWVATGALALSPAVFLPARRLARRADRRRFGPLLVGGLVLAALATLFLLLGADGHRRKAARAFSGLGGPAIRAVQWAADRDGDGYAFLLGGGDCDDSDPHRNPGALDIPDDGIDQDCVGGDLTLPPPPKDLRVALHYADVTASIPEKINILLLTIDTVRSDHIGAYGYERDTSPTIDAIARDGALFVDSWAHAPSTRYSIPAIITGRYPLAVRYDNSVWWPGISPEALTLAEVMKASGFTTSAILNYQYFSRERGMTQGFDHYDNENARLHRGHDPASTRGSSSRQQSDKALAWIARHADERFFLWVHYYDPHYQYEVHPGTPGFGDEPVDRYDHEIRFTDQHIARVIDDLKRRGLYERTVIVIAGDHGEGFGEHGVELHGYHLYGPQTRVPIIMRVPGLDPARITMPVGHVDILPTLANLVGYPPSREWQGRSLLGLLEGTEPTDTDRWVFQELSYGANNEMRATASQRCHIIYDVSPQRSWEVYRIDEDPGETRDVSDDPGPCADGIRELTRWYNLSRIPEDFGGTLLDGPPDLADPWDVKLGDSVRLLAVDLPDGPAVPGGSIPITFTFEALGTPDPGTRVFVHVEGHKHQRLQGDHEPARPFEWWRPGQFIRYTHELPVRRDVRPDTFDVWVGLFSGKQRLPARSKSGSVRIDHDRVFAGTVRVERTRH